MELHLDVDAAVAEYIEETGLAGHLSTFLSQVIFSRVFSCLQKLHYTVYSFLCTYCTSKTWPLKEIEIVPSIDQMRSLIHCTAKIVYRISETNIPRNETAWPQSQFLHSCFCEWFICPTIVCLFCCRKICRPILGIYCINRSQIHECGNWDWGRAVSFLRVHKSDFLCSVHIWYNIFGSECPFPIGQADLYASARSDS